MSGRNAPRSKNGCSTCRRRKVKCGEERPICKRCFNLQLDCEWGVHVKRDYKNAGPVVVRNIQPAQPGSGTNSPIFGTTIVPSGYSPSSSSTAPILAVWPFFSPYSLPNPIYPSPSLSEVPCANSLILSEHDQKYFQYFPTSSVVHYYMKAWKWSAFCHLYQGPAASSKVIMRMILALSASDMHRNGLVIRSPGRPTAEDHGRYHYGLAIKEFRQLLETPKREVSQAELEMIFATMFLMVTYEWQFGHSIRHLRMHLQGVRSLLESHPELFEVKDMNNVLLSMDADQSDESITKVSFIPEQFLLWIMYIDVNCRSMGVTGSLYDYVLQSGNPALHPDRLHRCARLWGRCFWGKQYPDQQVSDDMENYRALELLHVGMCLRYRTWQLLVDHPAVSGQTPELLFAEMIAIREQYSDIFITAKFARTTSTRRSLNTINMAITTFYAQVVFHRRIHRANVPPTPLCREAVTNIIEVVHKQYTSDPRHLRRLHWPLLMALIETNDPVQQDWLRQRLLELRGFHSEYIWANELADEISARQAVSGKQVDLAEFLRSHVLFDQ